jgi:thiamine pyrophosphokinase
MAELVDALDSGSSRGNSVDVRVILAAILGTIYMPLNPVFYQNICENVHSVALVANGAMNDYLFLASLVKTYDKCFAVDGGLIHCQAMGIHPDLIIGDWDSIPAELLASYADVPAARFPVDKDLSDLELALEVALHCQSVEKIGLFGATGKRIDHTMVNLQLLRRFPTKLVIETETETIFSLKGDRRFECFPGQTLSLVPMGPRAQGVTTKGLKWELTNASLDSHFFSLSNVCLGSYFDIFIAEGNLICCLLRP